MEYYLVNNNVSMMISLLAFLSSWREEMGSNISFFPTDVKYKAGLSSLGVILADQLTLFQPGGTDYAHLITTGTPGFSDLPSGS